MNGTGVQHSPQSVDQEMREAVVFEDVQSEIVRERQAVPLLLIWDHRRLIFRASVVGLIVSALIAFLTPRSYTSTTRLMPPDERSMSGMTMMAGLAAKAGGLGPIAGGLLGLKSSGALFIGVLRSQTSQKHIVNQFDLEQVYGRKLLPDAQKKLDENTSISEDPKSGIISISVTDHSPQRAAAIANAYVDELNSLVSQLSTSAAHRERVFLEERLKVAKSDLDDVSSQLAQFSSQNSTLDMQIEGKTMLDAAAKVTGELIAAQSQLEGLRQIYSDHSARVRSLNARVAELRKQLRKLGGVESSGTNKTTADLVESADPTRDQGGSASLPFPTIRNLPLLGAKYSDYYRRAKVQETVYELLTEQYELAKVEEAKETPSVKVLDPGLVPLKKSFPPRLLIMLLGTLLTCSVCIVGVVGTKKWNDADPKDPRKIVVMEVAAMLKARAHRFSRNGAEGSPHARWLRMSWSRREASRNGNVQPEEEQRHGPQ